MTRDELVEVVSRNESRTLIAYRIRETLGLPQPKKRKRARTRDKSAKARRYRGARKLMGQRYGVRP